MGLIRTMVTALFLSAWVMVHAVFLANLPPEPATEKTLLPVQIPSVFHLPWFRQLVKKHTNMEMLQFAPSRSAKTAVPLWASFFSLDNRSSRSSRFGLSRNSSSSNSGVAETEQRAAVEDYMRLLSWAVTAMTMAEWLSFAYLLWRILWLTILRPLVLVLLLLLCLLLVFYCIKGYFYAFGSSLLTPEDTTVALQYITSVDNLLHSAAKHMIAWNSHFLYILDQLLSVLFTPAAVLEQQQKYQQQQVLFANKQRAGKTITTASNLLTFVQHVQGFLFKSFESGGPAAATRAEEL